MKGKTKTIRITKELHSLVKINAAKEGINLEEYAEALLQFAIRKLQPKQK